MGLPGPSKTIVVEPVEAPVSVPDKRETPAPAPTPAPAEPVPA